MNPEGNLSDDQLRELFKEMRDEPMPADSLARVRMGVAQRTETRRGWWKLAAAIAVAGVLAGVWMWPRPEAPVQHVQVEAPAPEPPPIQPVAPEPVPEAPKPRPQRVVRRAPEPQLVSSNVVIRIETPDPEVVILLVN